MPTQRYKLTIAYRGTQYHGWQAQPAMGTWTGETPPEGQGIPTVQESIARALARVLRHPVALIGSSRTDAGVHAKGQLAHFDTEKVQIPKEGIRKAINHQLPPDIQVRAIDPVAQTYHAVHSTIRKRYQYFIWNSPDRPVFFSDLAWHRWQKLDVRGMRQAAEHFVGRHDFASFARPGHGRENTVRTVFACDVTCRPPKLILGVEGSGFLWNMVRIMVGTLVQVGIYRYPPEKIVEMIEARDRKASGPTAPPHGLYLQWIKTKKEDEEGPGETTESVEPAAVPLPANETPPEAGTM